MEKYMDAYKLVKDALKNNDVEVTHRSAVKFENGTNRDIIIKKYDKRICGIYVGVNYYKFYLCNATGNDKYNEKFENLDDCINKIKDYI